MVRPLPALEIEASLQALGSPQKVEHSLRFFKTGKGEYGEGDQFLGVTVPEIRRVARPYQMASDEVIEDLLSSPYHECRLCALVIWVDQFKKASPSGQELIYRRYLDRTRFINNWDLVDLSAPSIVGAYLLAHPGEAEVQFLRLAESRVRWEQRMAVVATAAHIRAGVFKYTLMLAARLLRNPHDLIHKAIGWMLREVGKREKEVLLDFLELHHKEMPRTMLRYSMERLSSQERTYFMRK